MTDFLQNLIVALLVLGAAAYVARHLWRSTRAGKSGGNCGCGAKKACGASIRTRSVSDGQVPGRPTTPR
ncbi:MAG: FeoB-associated Cys-rich membrane protein [Candidatus Sumerlaeia bacterium]|nr:FeoB-associated Cys-rich membrane protein [Candidatus Sumerlaeia bacterium]